MEKKIIAYFENNHQAEKAVKNLRDNGVKGEISILAKELKEEQKYQEEVEDRHYRVEGMEYRSRYSDDGLEPRQADGDINEVSYENQNLADGTMTGGVIGGLGGLALGAGLLIIPGLGPIIAAGPLAGILTGALTGGVAGGLVDYGIPEERSTHYESKVESGKILAIIKADERDVDHIAKDLREHHAKDVEVH
ncbi:hypothetical protein [Alkalicella caledoniensis]|nr:hypothetical protein [Alkalicella caledoniensis]